MKKIFIKAISILICACMVFGAAPLDGVKAEYLKPGYDSNGNPCADVSYTVNIYVQDCYGEYFLSQQIELYGTTDTTVTYVPDIPYLYSLGSNSVLSGTVSGDGSLVLSVYFNREISVIHGFHAGLTVDEAIDYLEDEYGGYVETEYSEYGPYAGTGTHFYRYDSAAKENLIEEFYIVIFGDVNGDSQISSEDVQAVKDEIIGRTCWSSKNWLEEYFPPKIEAADLNKDGKIDVADLHLVENVVSGLASINQETGEYILGEPEIPDGTFCGKLESSGITVVIDGNESWISPIVVDGISYKVKKNLIPDTIDEYIGQDVVFTVENGEIVWFSTVWDLVQKINCNLVVTDEITYLGKEYSVDEIDARVDVKYSYKGKNVAELKAILELGVAVSGVKLKSSNPDLLNFDGKAETMVLFNDIVPISGSASKNVKINVDSSYKISDLIEKEVVSITCDMSAAGDGKLIEKTPRIKNITVVNKNYEKPVIVEEPDEPEEPDENDTEATKAATAFDKIKHLVTIKPSTELDDLFAKDAQKAIGELVLCRITMASAPPKTFRGILEDKVIKKIFNYDDSDFNSLFPRNDGTIMFSLATKNKSGKDVTVEFKCNYSGMINGVVTGDIYYRISKPASMCRDSYSLFGYVSDIDISAFKEAAYTLAESELKEATKPWGDKVDWATDIIFGKTVNKILKYAQVGTVSDAVWEIITSAAKSIKIECPVDVYVYNSNDELVAAVEDNEVILTDDKAQITVNGDTKYVTLFDESYYIVYEATADGTMRVTVNEHANSEDIIRTVVIDEIPLESGTVFSQDIDGKILEDSNYSITEDDRTVYTPDSDETAFHYHETDGEWFEGKAVECTEDGWNYTLCNICGDWYKEIISCAGHIDTDENGYCDVCDSISNEELVKDIYISIATPETRIISYMESIKLYANAVNLPEGYKIEWRVEGEGVSIQQSINGKTCNVTSTSTGNVVIKAYVVDSKGNIVKDENGKMICDTEYFYSDANLWLRIVYFFKKLFGISTTTVQL